MSEPKENREDHREDDEVHVVRRLTGLAPTHREVHREENTESPEHRFEMDVHVYI